MSKKVKKQSSFSGMSNNKNAQLNRARSLTNTSESEPTIDTFSNIQNSNDIVRPPEKNENTDQIRPSKNSFNVGDYSKEIFVSISGTIILAIGGYLIFNKIQLSLLEKEVDAHKESIESLETKAEKSTADINEVKNGTSLINYRLGNIENRLDKAKR